MNKNIKRTLARTGLFILKPAAKIAGILKTHLFYDDALKNIEQVYTWNEDVSIAFKGGSEIIKPFLSKFMNCLDEHISIIKASRNKNIEAV